MLTLYCYKLKIDGWTKTRIQYCTYTCLFIHYDILYVQTPFSNPFPDTRKRMFKVTQGMSDPRLHSSPVELIGMYPGVVRMSAVTWATGRVRRTTTWSVLKPETAKSRSISSQ